MTKNLYSFKKALTEEGVIICFSGVVSQDILSSFASVIEKKLESMGNVAVAQNIFAIFVEMAQNIMSYSSEAVVICDNQKESPGVIVVGFDKSICKYYIKSGNTVKASLRDKITQRIDAVKDLDKDALKAMYKEMRKSSENAHDRGGGLGFLEIQRKATEPLGYSFDEIDDEHLFFSLISIV